MRCSGGCIPSFRDKGASAAERAWLHGVHVPGDYKCSDNYFDLLPGEKKVFTVKGAGKKPLTVESVR